MGSNGKCVAVGLSGGVDSCMAAWSLLKEGWTVTGVTMKIWDGSVGVGEERGGHPGCFGPGAPERLEEARAVAERLGIPWRVVDLSADFKREVLEYFREEYLRGRTPNPCAVCNLRVKLGLLPVRAREQGVVFDRFATGHYARVERDVVTGRWRLRRGVDEGKDQSYFLARLTQEQLSGLVFPLGGRRKEEIRALAREAGWGDLATKAESQDFIAGSDYAALFHPGEAREGDVVTREGRVLGRHRGLPYYTVGQRKGLGLGGGGTPWHVVELDAERNRVVVGRREELASEGLVAEAVNWMGWAGAPGGERRCRVQIRQRHRAAEAVVRVVKGAEGGEALEVRFDEPQAAVAPGQVAVVYEGDAVMASGVIRRGWGGTDDFSFREAGDGVWRGR